jgi:hypothetical protein
MKTFFVFASLLCSSFAHAASFHCQTERALECAGESCRMEDNISTRFSIRGKRAELGTYSMLLKGRAHVIPGGKGQATGFFLRTSGKAVNGGAVSIDAAGTIEANGTFSALIGGVAVTGRCR